MTTQYVDAWIGLGSNLDQPLQQLELALETLKQLDPEAKLDRSSFYQSKALIAESADINSGLQPDYINAVVRLQTSLEPHALLQQLQAIETLQGRVRDASTPRWSPRTLDLDILLYGDQVIDTADLSVPHPGIRLREFVLYPMYELDPTLQIPGLGAIEPLVRRCPMRGMKRLEAGEEQDVASAS